MEINWARPYTIFIFQLMNLNDNKNGTKIQCH